MDWLLVATAGFVGGLLNAVAGGGSFVTLPALIMAGLPPVSANATGTAALFPGYIASAWRFRKDITLPTGLGFAAVAFIAIAGGSLGAAVLLKSGEKLFAGLIPWLILIATLAFIVSPRIIARQASPISGNHSSLTTSGYKTLATACMLFCVCLYGGYFNGGLGIILLAALSLLGQSDLLGMNGLKNIVSVLLTAVAVLIYALGDAISLKYLLVVAVAATAGGYCGAAFAYRLGQKHLRFIVIGVGCLMSAVFFFGKLGASITG